MSHPPRATHRSPQLQRTDPARLPRAVERAAGWDSDLAFFLDYDGTLTPIVQDPSAAELPVGVRELLEELSKKSFVAIVSGRPIQTLQRFVQLPNLWYSGSHGLEILEPGASQPVKLPRSMNLDQLDRAAAQLTERLQQYPGALVERADLTCAVHFRCSAAEDIPAIRSVVEETHSHFPALEVGRGKCVYEFKPKTDWNKGRVVRHILQSISDQTPKLTPVYIGDDVTDEDAFQEIGDSGYCCIVIDPETPELTFARYKLDSQAEVIKLLKQLADRP